MLNKDNWSKWYVIHTKGTGLRIKMKERVTAVEGGAGSVSQMIKSAKYLYETNRVNNIRVIRFHPQFVHNNQWLLENCITLEDYLLQKQLEKIPEGQLSLEEW